MKQLIREQFLPIPIEKAWAFFSSPVNLNLITPENMHFKITCELPTAIYTGLLITYKVSPIPLMRLNWCTEIIEVNAPHYFADIQKRGPYKSWRHEHHFISVDGGIMMTDIVRYEIGKSIFGWLAGQLFVHKKVKQIFDFRRKKVDDIFRRDV